MIRPQKSLVRSIYKIEKGFKNDNKLKEELIEKIETYTFDGHSFRNTQKSINEQLLRKI